MIWRPELYGARGKMVFSNLGPKYSFKQKKSNGKVVGNEKMRDIRKYIIWNMFEGVMHPINTIQWNMK